MTGEAASVDIFGRGFLEKEQHGDIRWGRNVGGGSTVTILAAMLRDSPLLVCLTPVRASLPALILSCVAVLTAFRAGEFLDSRRRSGSCRLRRVA